MSGLSSKRFKVSENGKFKIGYTKSIKFNKDDISLYKEKFTELKEKKIVVEGEFEADKWVLLGQERLAYYCFNDNVNYEINLALKMYIIIKIYDEGINPRSIIFHYSAINFILEKTNQLSVDSFNNLQYEMDILEDNYMQKYIMRFGYDFICFYDSVKYKKILNILLKYKVLNANKHPRQLPNFKSIIFFDSIVEDFQSICSMKEKNIYFPILLWWNITKSIPMRPIEFSHLEVNCVSVKDGRYILKVPKCKKVRSIDINDDFREVEVTEELYELIKQFIQMNDGLNEQKYLFNYEIYKKENRNQKTYNESVLCEYRENLGGTGKFYCLLNQFYEEIVEKKYKYKTTNISNIDRENDGQTCIERIRPGDTRHFAICNMYLQGFNPLTIARLAGHETLNIQLNYAKHLNTFADSQVKILSNKIVSLRSINNVNQYSDIKNIYRKSLFFNEKISNNFRRIENGFCIDNDFPNNCISGECIICDYFRFDFDSSKDVNKVLVNKSNYFNGEIKIQINIIRNIIKKSVLNKSNVHKNKNMSISEQQDIGVASKKLQQAIVEKAIIDSYIFECRKVEKHD